MTRRAGNRRRRFGRTHGIKTPWMLDVVNAKQVKTAGRDSCQEIARQTDNSESAFASRSHNSTGDGYPRVPDSQNHTGGVQ